MNTKKFIPEIGEHVTILSHCGSEKPYTVVGYEKGKVIIQECSLIFRGTRYYDTVADEVRPNPFGKKECLSWCSKFGYWHKRGKGLAVFGRWTHAPYCN